MNEMMNKTTGVGIEAFKNLVGDIAFVEEVIKPLAEEGETFIDALLRYLCASLDSLMAEFPCGEYEDEKKVSECILNMIRSILLPANEFDCVVFNEWFMKLKDLYNENPRMFAWTVSDEQQEKTDEE